MLSRFLKKALNFRQLVVLLLGISSGVPLLLVGGTLQAWMFEEHVDLKTVGIFALVGLPYTLKFIWSPIMDRFVPPFLGRRRGWMVITQAGLVLSLSCLAFSKPAEASWEVAFFALIVAFFSASQDIVIDAYRTELLNREELGWGSALAVNGYRIGMLLAGAFALFLADQIPWKMVYLSMAGIFLVSICVSILAPETAAKEKPPQTLKDAVWLPLKDYFTREGALEVLLFICIYKIGDVVGTSMTTPFFLHVGFTKTQIGIVAKTSGIAAVITGGLIGGLILLRMTLGRALIIFGVLQALGILSFITLEGATPSVTHLAAVMAIENFTIGLGTTAFTAFVGSLCDRRFTATQYALLSSLMSISRVFASAPAGLAIEKLGWTGFFIMSTALAIPGMLMLIFRFRKWDEFTLIPSK